MHEAAADLKLSQLLLSHGADPRIQGPGTGISPLHLAARRGSAEVCQLLLEAEVDVNIQSKDGSSPLHDDAQHAHTDVIDLLVKSGAAISAEDDRQRTPLLLAVTSSYLDATDADKLVPAVTALLSHGAGKRQAEAAWPQLDAAARHGHLAVVKLLLDEGVTGSARTVAAATRGGHLAVVTFLLKAGIKAFEDTPLDEPTPLHYAAFWGHSEICQVLIENGAPPTGKLVMVVV